MPKISVIMSVYNGEEYLREAVESVMNQTFSDWELIVINDCSTDSTASILEELSAKDSRVKVYPNEVNLRLPKSLNRAMTFASGKYIARMDADDICVPSRLAKQYEFMEKNPDIALASCKFMTLKKEGIASGGCGGRVDDDSLRARLLFTNPILHPGIIARAEVIKSLQYDPSFTCTEDMELWTRFALNGHKMAIQEEYLMLYRIHDKQITSTTLARQHDEVLRIQKTYYPAILQEMDEEMQEFYINGIYFRHNLNVKKFCEFYKWAKSVNAKTKKIDKKALNYAFFEILAEYKRTGISKGELIKAMLSFGPLFLMKEIPDRKKRARADGLKCIKAAETVG